MASKHDSVTILDSDPLNAAPSPEELRRRFVTPTDRFFVRNHGAVPEVDPQTYRLKVHGEVENELELSLEDLRRDFPVAERMVTLQCAGNRRDELSEVDEITGEVPWNAGALGNAFWEGVELAAVLEAAVPKPEAHHVAFEGLDITEETDGPFGGSIHLEKAMEGLVLLADRMNGKPLPPEHGFPLRVVVPGTIGARSVKWLGSIYLRPDPSRNHFQQRAYRLYPPIVKRSPADPSLGVMLDELVVNSAICSPTDGDRLKAGKVSVDGYALAGGGRTVETIEVSSDGGETWEDAERADEDSRWTWVHWSAELDLAPGTHELVVRAVDSDGNEQPEVLGEVWNCKGYMNNAWHRIRVTVAEE